MGRLLILLIPMACLAGCGAAEGMRTAPITKAATPGGVEAHAETRPPRAIATH
jgi:hypothetical protein